MTRRALLALPVLLAACQEYGLTPDKASEAPAEDSAAPEPEPEDSAEPEPELCLDQTLPAFDTIQDESCVNEVATGTFTPVVEWARTSFTTASTYNNVMMQPIVVSLTDDDGDGDIDSDDTPDILVTSYAGASWTTAGALRALSGADGAELWTNTAEQIEGSGNLAAGDIDGDGVVEIIAVTATGKQVVAFEHDGTVKWRSSALSLPGCYATAPAIGDLDGDGDPEIVVANHILNSDGSLRAQGAATGGCASFPVDLDLDGQQEVIAGSAVFDIDGRTLWTTARNGYPAVADFDADGLGEVVVVTEAGGVDLYDTGGALLWSVPSAGYGPPTIADFDGDGQPEVGVAGRSTYTVLDTDGSKLWQNATVDASSGRTGSAVFDFEGDGAAEVVYADEYTVWVYSGVDGAVKLQEPTHTSWTWIEYPTIVDVDGDGEVEIVVSHGSIGGSSAGATFGVSVIGDADHSWMPGRKIWNQHAYSITNVTDGGGIPAAPVANWLSTNNFRSGDLRGATGTDAPDVRVTLADTCEIECGEDRLWLWLHLGNAGLADLRNGATLELRADVDGTPQVLETLSISEVLTAGRMAESLQFQLEDPGIPSWDAIEAEVVPAEPECNPDNNVLRIDGPFCAGG